MSYELDFKIFGRKESCSCHSQPTFKETVRGYSATT